MLKGFPAYLLAIPSFVGSASAYNLSRLADISWGNRPAASAKQYALGRSMICDVVIGASASASATNPPFMAI